MKQMSPNFLKFLSSTIIYDKSRLKIDIQRLSFFFLIKTVQQGQTEQPYILTLRLNKDLSIDFFLFYSIHRFTSTKHDYHTQNHFYIQKLGTE